MSMIATGTAPVSEKLLPPPLAASPSPSRVWWCATAAAAVVFAWMAFTVHRNYNGNWTGLFCIGDRLAFPREVKENAYLFRNSTGFDGSYYLTIAHDPLVRLDYWRYLDWPSLRYRRILVPLLAQMASFGNRRVIPEVYVGVVLAFLFAGAWFTSAYLAVNGISPWFGLAYAAMPVTLISADRMVVDGALLACIAGACWFHARGSTVGIVGALALGALCRETGVLACVSFAAVYLMRGRRMTAAACGLAAAPAAVWAYLLSLRFEAHAAKWAVIDFKTFVTAMRQPQPGRDAWIHAMDLAALAACAVVIAWGLGLLLHGPSTPLRCLAFAQSALCAYLFCVEDWFHVYDHGRLMAPVLFAMMLEAISRRAWWLLAPGAVLTLRVLAQMSPQVFRL